MDEMMLLRHRIMALEAVVRRQDRLLKSMCQSLSTFNLDPKLKKEAQEYLNVFDEDEITRKKSVF